MTTAEDLLAQLGEAHLEELTQEDFDEFALTEEELADLGFEMTNERQVKRVVRKGKVQKKVFCRPGFKAKDGKCVPMSAKEKAVRKRAAIKGGRKRKTQSKTKANISRKRSLKKRNSIAK